jgi:3-hydroxyacyl-[acyl-carrier-protein] dehydratase
MKFVLIDSVLEQSPERIVAVKQVSLAEEYLADHFPGFPVLPGVLMVEAMVQAARLMLAARTDQRLVLREVKQFKFGNMVRPGEKLVVEVTLHSAEPDGSFTCKAIGRVVSAAANGGLLDDAPTAVSGRFTLRPAG